MLPLLARKYVYRYLVLAIALPIVARLCLYADSQDRAACWIEDQDRWGPSQGRCLHPASL